MTGEFVLRIWSPGATAPAGSARLHTEPLALDRDLLGVHDGSISRTGNAPKLTPSGVTQFRLEVPATSARPVLAIEGIRFEALQHDIHPPGQAWKIAPAQLARPARLACGSSVSVALVRQLDWERPGPTHHLLVLPRLVSIAPGQTLDLLAPAFLLIGEAAVDITPADTVIPATVPVDTGHTASFRLRDLEDKLSDPSHGIRQLPEPQTTRPFPHS